MRKFSVFLFAFIFLFNIPKVGNCIDKNSKIDKIRLTEKIDSISDSVKKETLVRDSLVWQTAIASYYNPYDRKQTKKKPDGLGTSDRHIRSGSISFGSSSTRCSLKKGLIIFIEVKDCPIVTPYGKGIFRIDDSMGKRFNKDKKFYIDFFQKDLDSKHKRMGRFKVKFRIYKIVNPDNDNLSLSGFFYSII